MQVPLGVASRADSQTEAARRRPVDRVPRCAPDRLDIAKAFSAKIWLPHCYQLHPGGVSPYGIAAPASYHDDVREAVVHQLRERQEKIEAEGVPAEASVSSEFPPQAIVEMAKDIGADLIVMGTRGLTGIKHVMLGSVVERTVRSAPCPVLIVKTEEAN
jgi:nucleotide-binding universal stress UspA family protein